MSDIKGFPEDFGNREEYYNPLEGIDTHSLTEKDFKDHFMSSVRHYHLPCPKCGARVCEWCKKDGQYIRDTHRERTQALFDKLLDVINFVKGETDE